MDDLERKLKALRLRPPSDELDERVRGEAPLPRVVSLERWGWLSRWRVPVWAAAAASLFMVLLGFAGGAVLVSRRPVTVVQTSPPVVEMRVVYTNSATNPFDVTRASQDFLPGPMNVKVHVEGGV